MRIPAVAALAVALGAGAAIPILWQDDTRPEGRRLSASQAEISTDHWPSASSP